MSEEKENPFISALAGFFIVASLSFICYLLYLNVETNRQIIEQMKANTVAVEENTQTYQAMIIMLGSCSI